MSDYKSPYQQHYDEGYIDGQELAQQRISALEAEAEILKDSEWFYSRRCEALQKIQHRMRDPERQMVCDILANGQPRDLAGVGYYAPPEAI